MSNNDPAYRHERAIAVETLKMNKVGASIMGGKTHREAREFLFLEAYRSAVPANAILRFVNKHLADVKSTHKDTLIHFCKNAAGKKSDDLYPMTFGMMYDAWNKLQDDAEDQDA